jgi:hypothetical protein
MYPLDADPEQEVADGELCADHRTCVEEVAEPPALSRHLDLLDGQIIVVAASSIADSNVGGYGVQDEEELWVVS